MSLITNNSLLKKVTNSNLLSGLVGYFKLDNTAAGPVVNEVGSPTGYNSGFTIDQAGKNGRCYRGADSQFVQLGDHTGTDFSEITMNVWINLDNMTSRHALMMSNHTAGALLMYVKNDGSIGLGVYTGSTLAESAPGKVSSGSWIMCTARYRTVGGSTLESRVFVNGLSVDARSIANVPSFGPFYLGYSVDSVGWLNGLIDEVGLWNRCLTSKEILQLYRSGAGLFYDDF